MQTYDYLKRRCNDIAIKDYFQDFSIHFDGSICTYVTCLNPTNENEKLIDTQLHYRRECGFILDFYCTPQFPKLLTNATYCPGGRDCRSETKSIVLYSRPIDPPSHAPTPSQAPTSSGPTQSPTSSSSPPNSSTILTASLVSVFAVLILIAAFVIYRRRRRRDVNQNNAFIDTSGLLADGEHPPSYSSTS
jgi:hypothetical protein